MKKIFVTIALLSGVSHFSAGQADQASTKPESYRPQYHFSPPKNWINDPNGLLYYEGEYHLFYQHNPFGNEWGHMSWGHAVSKDLLRWEHLPVAIPEFTHSDGKTKTAIFSGSAVIDKGNTSGLCPAGTKDCMVAIYTGNVTEGETQTAQYQNVAYSSDKGRTWKQYDKNPVLDLKSKEFRDPNVFWYAPQKKWIMSAVKATEHRVAFFESKDLTKWTLLSHFGLQGDTTKVWECPALMPVPIQNEPGKTKWVLFISAGHPQKDYVGMQYFVGDFDGKTFSLDPANPKPIAPAVSNVVDYGKDYYAAIQFNDLPAKQTGPVMVGWLNNWAYGNKLPTTPFKGAMSLPRQITLKRTSAGLQLMQQPIATVASLRSDIAPQALVKVSDQSRVVEKSVPNSYEFRVDIKPGSAKTVGVRLAKNGAEETIIQYTNGKLQLDRRKSGNVSFSDRFPSVEEAPLNLQNGVFTLRVFVDKSIVEVFANEGERVITDLIFPGEPSGSIEIFAEGGSAEFSNVRVSPIKAVVAQ
ncbi:glycoside hydrolase family 32 protein [Spirosoma utsteinense]|uniref:Fructan beta-fructosidase n=1 Tax=Spirosoma utsteinense TaxID=2585773 RepID=A0ABR6WCZ4_9BACT|nr:glycoside hydrolase family 32 protein [Spirosoma utsteinense]MBC3788800.1 fructan beta-fructosidase [Spirosoma utsteinense]MBC3794394.1 fructan beta-fructosidase [Spirosoma utsteinense]